MSATLQPAYSLDVDLGIAMPVLDHICILFLRDLPLVLFGACETELHHAARIAMLTHGTTAARATTLQFQDGTAKVVSNMTLVNDSRWTGGISSSRHR